MNFLQVFRYSFTFTGRLSSGYYDLLNLYWLLWARFQTQSWILFPSPTLGRDRYLVTKYGEHCVQKRVFFSHCVLCCSYCDINLQLMESCLFIIILPAGRCSLDSHLRQWVRQRHKINCMTTWVCADKELCHCLACPECWCTDKSWVCHGYSPVQLSSYQHYSKALRHDICQEACCRVWPHHQEHVQVKYCCPHTLWGSTLSQLLFNQEVMFMTALGKLMTLFP